MRPRIFNRLLAAAAVAMVIVGASAADAYPSRSVPPLPASSELNSVAQHAQAAVRAAGGKTIAKYGIAPLDHKTGLLASAVARSAKAKIVVNVPRFSTLLYTYVCFQYAASTLPPRCSNSGNPANLKDYPTSFLHAGDGLQIAYGYPWMQSPPGSTQPFGIIARIPVQALAFGSIPVSATITVQQKRQGNLIVPLNFKNNGYYFASAEDFNGIPAGTYVPGLGRAPKWPSGKGSAPYFPSVVGGDVTVTVSDVSVDQRPLDVGSACEALDSNLRLASPPGFAEGTAASGKLGRPDEFVYQDSQPGGWLTGNLDIGPFAGCGVGHEDLSALLSSFVSSPSNPVTVQQFSGATATWCAKSDHPQHFKVGSADCKGKDAGSPADGYPDTGGFPGSPAATTTANKTQTGAPEGLDAQALRRLKQRGGTVLSG